MVAWTIEELVDEAARALAEDAPQPSGRVNDAPDLRTIRYYATLGLLDAPRAFAKKKALYDQRHLNQLIAIKRLQREGLSLAEIQTRLAGVTDVRLRGIAEPPPPVRERFWRRQPPAPAPVRAVRVTPGITLVIDATPRPFTDDDAAALRRWLEARGLAAREDS